MIRKLMAFCATCLLAGAMPANAAFRIPATTADWGARATALGAV